MGLRAIEPTRAARLLSLKVDLEEIQGAAIGDWLFQAFHVFQDEPIDLAALNQVFVTLDGNPVAGAHVTFTSRNQFVQSVTTGPDGKAQLTNALLGGVTPVEYNCTIPTTGIGAANNPITPAFFYNATLVMNPYTIFYCRFYSVIQGSSENNAAFLASGVMGSAMLLSLTIVYAKRLQAKRKKGGRYA